MTSGKLLVTSEEYGMGLHAVDVHYGKIFDDRGDLICNVSTYISKVVRKQTRPKVGKQNYASTHTEREIEIGRTTLLTSSSFENVTLGQIQPLLL